MGLKYFTILAMLTIDLLIANNLFYNLKEKLLSFSSENLSINPSKYKR